MGPRVEDGRSWNEKKKYTRVQEGTKGHKRARMGTNGHESIPVGFTVIQRVTVVQKVQRGTERYRMVEKVEVPSDSDASHVSILLSGEAAPIE